MSGHMPMPKQPMLSYTGSWWRRRCVKEDFETRQSSTNKFGHWERLNKPMPLLHSGKSGTSAGLGNMGIEWYAIVERRGW